MSLAGPLAALLALAHPRPARDSTPTSQLRVTIDSSRHEVIVLAGPFRVPPSDPEMEHMMMMGGQDHSMDMPLTPVQTFSWPVTGWMHGFKVELLDGEGRVLPQRLMHHLIAVNFSRRQLVYPAVERLMGVGEESDHDVSIPKSIGVPLTPGQEIGVYVMWNNQTGQELPAVYYRLVLRWLPRNLQPRPIDALPIYMDVNLSVGGDNTFNVPPGGRFTKAFEFVPPVSGHLLGVSGHLHDYGLLVRLEDAESGKELVAVPARRDSTGKVLGMPRRLLAIRGEGIRIKAGHRYRVVGVYENTTRDTLYGAMAHMVGLFAPDDMRRWPAIDPADTSYRKDVADLRGKNPNP
jgi:hypothetical protein